MSNVSLCSPRASSGIHPTKLELVNSLLPPNIPSNHVLLKVERFGFSANNVTYQVLGEHPHFRYYDFHPAPHSFSAKYGLVPVWSFATVVLSSHPGINIGERVYGYLAPTKYLLLPVSPKDINQYAFYVPRSHLPADRRPYNQILRCATDTQYSPATEDHTMLYRPLFWTAYWCEDWLHTSQYRNGAGRVVISSASSKTAFCLAYLIKKRREREGIRIHITGVTSGRNTRFCQGLGLYDDVVEYDRIGELPAPQQERWIYVDVAGNADFNARLRAWFASPYTPSLACSVALGFSNLTPSQEDAVSWSASPSYSGNQKSQGDASQFWPLAEPFFMPEWLDVRRKELSTKEITKRQKQAWAELMVDCPSWVKIQRVYGPEKVKKAYENIVQNNVGPETGLIWSLWDEEKEGHSLSKL